MHILYEQNKLGSSFNNEGIKMKSVQYDYKILWGVNQPQIMRKTII